MNPDTLVFVLTAVGLGLVLALFMWLRERIYAKRLETHLSSLRNEVFSLHRTVDQLRTERNEAVRKAGEYARELNSMRNQEVLRSMPERRASAPDVFGSHPKRRAADWWPPVQPDPFAPTLHRGANGISAADMPLETSEREACSYEIRSGETWATATPVEAASSSSSGCDTSSSSSSDTSASY